MSNTATHSVEVKSIEPASSSGLKITFLRISQFITWPILYLYFNARYKVMIQGRENLDKVSGSFLIIANHINFMDAFLFRLALGFITPHLPLRFMAVKKFIWRGLNFLESIGIIGIIYRLFGVFTIVPGLGLDENLRDARRILRTGGRVVVYPEGKIAATEKIGEFRPGASILAQELGVPVVPVSFRAIKGNNIRKSLFVNIGEPIIVPNDIDTDGVTTILENSISNLYSITSQSPVLKAS